MLDDQPLGPFTNHRELDQLAYQFFRQFSRSEYALKTVGHLKRPDGVAEADWKGFGDSVDEALHTVLRTHDDLREACSYLLDMPPKKQVVRGGQLGWDDGKPDAKTDSSLLLQYVCRVRNNLFHGGKFNGQWFEPERSELLLQHSLTVPGYSVAQSPGVLEAYTH
jgi:hypothetical protein